MTPQASKNEFAEYIQQFGTPLAELTLAQGIKLMLDFYRDIRAEGCLFENDADMLLFQWGTNDFKRQGRTFQVGVTRQFIGPESPEDLQGQMSALTLTFHFAPTAESDAIKNDSRWCSQPDELTDFGTFIDEHPACKLVASTKPAKITLEYGEI